MADLTTLASVKAFGNITGTDATRDALLEDLIDGVSAAMESYVGRTLTSATYTGEKIDGTGVRFLMLKNYPVTTFTSLSESGTVVDASRYTVDLDAGLVLATGGSWWTGDGGSGTWTQGTRNFSATYVAGFLTVPEDLVNAANRQVLLEFKRSGYKGDRIGLSTSTLSDGSVASYLTGEWAEGVQGVLDRYRRVA